MANFIDHPKLVAALANAQNIILECDRNTEIHPLSPLEYWTTGPHSIAFERTDYVRCGKDLITLRIGGSRS